MVDFPDKNVNLSSINIKNREKIQVSNQLDISFDFLKEMKQQRNKLLLTDDIGLFQISP